MTQTLVYQPEQLSEDQWVAKEKHAARLAKVTYIPADFRNKPDNILAANLAFDAIGFPTTAVTLKMAYVVNGTVDFLVDLYKALVYQHGHEMWVVEESAESATVAGKRAGSDRVETVTFTIDDARRANLLGKDNWKSYPRDMLVARASKRVAKRIAPEAILGLPPPMAIAREEEGGRRVVIVNERTGEIEDDDDVVDAELVEEEPHTRGESDEAADAEGMPDNGDATTSSGEVRGQSTRAGAVAEPTPNREGEERSGDTDVATPPATLPPFEPTCAADWRAKAKEVLMPLGDLLRQAKAVALAQGTQAPATLEELHGSPVAAEIGAWLNRFTRKPEARP